MNPEENARRMREAIEKTGWTPPQPQPAQPSWAALASNPALAVGLRFNLGDRPLERFARGLMKPLPDNAVPDFAKPMQSDWEAKPGTVRRAVGDWLSRPGEPGESWPLIGPAGPMVRQMGGAILNDPIEALSEFSGYAPASRAFDAGAQALDEEDPVAAAGQWARSLGEGGMAAATVAGNAYGLGSLGAKAYRGGPVAALPDADMAGLKGRLAKAQTAGPSQIQTLIDDAGARAAAAESKIKPVDWSQVDMPEPAAAAAPQAPRDWAINIEGRTAPGRLRPRPEPDAYTPLDMTPEEQAAIDLSRQYQGRTSMWDQPSLSPAGPRAPAALSPEQKAAMNAEIERLALQAEDAGKAGDTGAVAKAHEDIASIMARTGRPLETSPRLQAIQDRIDAIDRELKTADGAWREEELLAEAEALMNERRELRGKAPRQGALGNSSTLGMGGGNLWDDSGMSVADSIGNFVRKLRKSPAGDQEPTFRASEPNLTFGGQRAATADTGALAKAQELDAAGAPREQIWAETGWFKGVDEKWRFEIDDSGARLSDVATSDLNRLSEYSGTLKNGFDHPDLFKAYPSLAPEKFDAYTVPFQRGARFQEAGSSPYTAAGGPNAASIRSATLHESMHGVQGAEGFATGSSYKRVMENPELRAEAFAAARENLRPVAFDDYAAKWEIPDTPYARADHASLVKQQQQALQNLDALEQKADWTGQTDVPQALKNATDTLYRRHAGEVEARNVQTRRDWTPEQRRETPPWMSQDISDDQQIVTFSSASASDTSPTILGSNGGNLGAEGGALSRRSGQAPWVDERGLIPALKKMAEENGGKLPNGYANRLSEQFQMPAQTVRSRVSRLRESDSDIQKIAPQREFNRTDLTDRDVMIGIADGDRTIDIAADFNASRNSVNAKAKAMENAIRKRLADGETKSGIAAEYGVTEDVLDAFMQPRRTGPKASNAAKIGFVGGMTYVPAKIASDIYSDAQEEGTLPAWMVGLPRDPAPTRPGL